MVPPIDMPLMPESFVASSVPVFVILPLRANCVPETSFVNVMVPLFFISEPDAAFNAPAEL